MCCTRRTKPFAANLWLCLLALTLSSSSGSARTDEITISSKREDWHSPDDGDRNMSLSHTINEIVATSLLHDAETTWTNHDCSQEAGEMQLGRFPYLCSLRLSGNRKHVCTAVLIGQRWLLAAAHCVDPNLPESAGCYPLVYCGSSQLNTPCDDKIFHVVEAYVHEDWIGDVIYGSDIAMLMLDRKAAFPVPRLFREGMALEEDMELLSSKWRMGRQSVRTQQTDEGSSVTMLNRDLCRRQPEIISKKSWLCIGEDATVSWKGESARPLLLTDQPKGHLQRGVPEEDLLIGVMSFDASHPRCQLCSVYTSVAFFRDWILRTMNGSSVPSRCVLLPRRVLETPGNYSYEWPIPTTSPQVEPTVVLPESEYPGNQTAEEKKGASTKAKKKRKPKAKFIPGEPSGISQATDLIREKRKSTTVRGMPLYEAEPPVAEPLREIPLYEIESPVFETKSEVLEVESPVLESESESSKSQPVEKKVKREETKPKEKPKPMTPFTESQPSGVLEEPGRIREKRKNTTERGAPSPVFGVRSPVVKPEKAPREQSPVVEEKKSEPTGVKEEKSKEAKPAIKEAKKESREQSPLVEEKQSEQTGVKEEKSKEAKPTVKQPESEPKEKKPSVEETESEKTGTGERKAEVSRPSVPRPPSLPQQPGLVGEKRKGHLLPKSVAPAKQPKTSSKKPKSTSPGKQQKAKKKKPKKQKKRPKPSLATLQGDSRMEEWIHTLEGLSEENLLFRMIEAIKEDDQIMAEDILRIGLNPNAVHEEASLNELLLQRGASLLHWSAIFNASKCAEVLLKDGAHVDALDAFDRTPLHCAARLGRWHIAKILVMAGASKSSEDHEGRTPLSSVCAPIASCSDETRSAISKLLIP